MGKVQRLNGSGLFCMRTLVQLQRSLRYSLISLVIVAESGDYKPYIVVLINKVQTYKIVFL